MTRPTYTTPQADSADERAHRRQIAQALQGAMQGKQNNVLDVTLKTNATSTAIKDSRLSPISHFVFTPVTADAAALAHAGTIWPSARGKGTATISHPSSGSADLQFTVQVSG